MEFPIYRKYKGIDVWFKILSPTEFMEYKKLGSQLKTEHIIATIFPEKQFIQDMINYHEDRWIETNQKELDQFLLSV